MRALFAVLAIAAALGGALVPLPAVAGTWLDLGLTGIQESVPNIDVEIGERGGDGWGGVHPLWIIVGGLALVLLAILIAMSVKGTGTTVVRG